ncbi:MAG: DUF3536 domain-containing protein [Gemmatimonadaceae bacterium]|nr:DUF3536 domain-containing protein [Gemmatimonadaceae bacterium]
MRSLILHAHFYQPPREDPFFGDVDAEAGAAPFHDWNQRIERECYRTVVAARVTGDRGRILRLVNTLEWISYNVGATLFEWMEVEAPATYQAFLAADRASVARLGHGNAMAQPYHHVILPLASRRDKVSEVRWGIADFRRRYGRDPEGMWLPETAVDDETLDVLAQEGMRFTVLAPYQVVGAPPNGLPGRYVTNAGRAIAVVPYHGDISHGIAFGGFVRDADAWARALGSVPQTDPALPMLVSAATDGETYGHHHKFAEMALARVLERAREGGMTVENHASFLARHPATHDVELVAPSAWSCAHGVERWRSNCGCRIDGQSNPNQAWRTPLRNAMTGLQAGIHAVFQREGASLFTDSWGARDAWGEVVASADAVERERHVATWLRPGANAAGVSRALELLEMERDAMRAVTSCAWFFDDIGGLEVRQVLRYAARALALSGDTGRLERALSRTLGNARSNHASVGTGADVWRSLQHPATAAERVAAAAKALHDLNLDPAPHLPSGMAATVEDDAVEVAVRATGRRHRFVVALQQRTPSDLSYMVRGSAASSTGHAVPLSAFPERARHGVRTALRQALLPRFLTPTELEHLASGEASLRGLVAVALTRAIRHLAADQGQAARDLAHGTLDLFEQLEVSVPFDAQTAWWEVASALAPAEREPLRDLGRRLGFAEGVLP